MNFSCRCNCTICPRRCPCCGQTLPTGGCRR